MKVPGIFVLEKNLEFTTEKLLKEVEPSVQPKYNKFEVIHADIYVDGIAKLKELNQKPFTFAENIEARIADYEANGKNAKLFMTWLDSVTGIIYKAYSTKFKLILKSDKLENINPSSIPIDYDTEQGIELDSKDDKYDQSLTRKEAKEHEFWIAVMGGDKKKLAKYVDIWFDKTGKDKGMGVHLRGNRSQDEFWAFVLGDDKFYSNAFGVTDIEVARFIVSD